MTVFTRQGGLEGYTTASVVLLLGVRLEVSYEKTHFTLTQVPNFS